jgi:Ca2+-binding RTX toxin-like protein
VCFIHKKRGKGFASVKDVKTYSILVQDLDQRLCHLTKQQVNQSPNLPITIYGYNVVTVGVCIKSTLPTSSVWAATIQYKASNNVCAGTDTDDTMIGDDGFNFINSRFGNDVVNAKGGSDHVEGDEGNDKIYGAQGNDFILGQEGADLKSGGDGTDEIYHSSASLQKATDPDGSKDRINCGAGNDEAWINVSVDHDIAANCETLHTG